MSKYKHFIFLFLNLVSSLSYANDVAIRIGVIAPLTGGMATIGNALKNGIELAKHESPRTFENLEFIYEDDQYDAKQSLSAYRKLKDYDKVDIIFGFGIKLGNALGPIVEKERVLLLNFNFEATPAIGKKYVIRAMNSTQHYMKEFAEYIKKNNNKRYSYIRTEISFFSAMANDFKNALGPEYKVDELAVVNPDEVDFKLILSKLKSSDQKNVGLFLLPDQIISFTKQARSLGAKFNYFGTDLFETVAGISNSERLLDGSLYPDNEASPEFRKKYLIRFGNESQMTFASNGYEMALLFAELLGRQKPYAALSLVESLSTITKRNGSLGEYSFKKDPENGMYFDFPIFVKEIDGSKGIVVK